MKTIIIHSILYLALSHISLGKSTSIYSGKDSIQIIDYYENGIKKLEGWYVVDSIIGGDTLFLAVGKQISYYKSGKVKAYQYFKLGVPDGEFVSYNENEITDKTYYMKDGKLNGSYVYYYPDGNTMRAGTFKNDKDFGVSRKYYKNGKLSLEESYNENGIQEGEVKHYNQKGELIKMEILFNGKKKK